MHKYLIVFLGLILGLLLLAIFSLPDRNLHVIFCDVGQGDAILITYGTTQMLVDGGPDSKVLSCLGSHLPFWDRKIEVLVASHPQEDHFVGLIDVVRRYSVGVFAYPGVEGVSSSWQVFRQELENRKIDTQKVAAGNSIRTTNLHFDIVNPVQNITSGDLNDYSIVGTLSFRKFDVLLTGDILPSMNPFFLDKINPIEVLKVPHHGSKNGLTPELLERSSPKLAVISVGKKNSYGHPHEEVIRLLSSWGVKVLRTDLPAQAGLDGEVEVVSDGEKWWVR